MVFPSMPFITMVGFKLSYLSIAPAIILNEWIIIAPTNILIQWITYSNRRRHIIRILRIYGYNNLLTV